ncbi:DUF3226 domain-containing protein [Planktothrix agardhii 1806]|uniref:DUF3226 domain-containing protein n=1 Tax=Planktothrix agardhii (strain NIVA-CYA 126/8) TaxID=388467 RepID=A0A073CC36_PLAA1|nr:DUF3226 domain-containing protein [Planktothrix agardhii]MCF3608197.1 DUF3226 domain-containing protein [Planktothrix agardhii 1033]MEA5560782.1 DUF3226 domain-containing protein [Planktothrix agardhii UHCC 0887]KEI65854.1 hypothetical protein A19Y_0683 [Planktothrix agardhii NIVA-CYA 126/8]MCF3569564.1 DUF3226 domain-containing protein [Planktothrix agardhii 1805]MCF3583580.1 DUF3226 domain-containing protein [Planktothrix agardhii 1803]
MSRYALIGVEGNHDQAFLEKILRKLLGFSKLEDQKIREDLFWEKFIPKYPAKSLKLHTRLDMPTILYKDDLLVGIYGGEGSKLIQNLGDKLSNISDYSSLLSAFGIVADADKNTPNQVVTTYHNGLKEYFPDFPNQLNEIGSVTDSKPKLGIYILPDNTNQGVLDTLLCTCGEVAYPEYMQRAKDYINQFSETETKKLGWKPFDKEKATIATVVSVLKPGKTNTVSIADNAWISLETQNHIPKLSNLSNFLARLLDLKSVS